MGSDVAAIRTRARRDDSGGDRDEQREDDPAQTNDDQITAETLIEKERRPDHRDHE